jgi:16S rRNA G966 N2-methylase RsmD
MFADPPYAFEATGEIPGIVFGAGLLRRGGYLIIEHAADLAFAGTAVYRAGPVKRFGRTYVTFFSSTNGRNDAP